MFRIEKYLVSVCNLLNKRKYRLNCLNKCKLMLPVVISRTSWSYCDFTVSNQRAFLFCETRRKAAHFGLTNQKVSVISTQPMGLCLFDISVRRFLLLVWVMKSLLIWLIQQERCLGSTNQKGRVISVQIADT
jgi:hypothetical protein